LQQPLLHPKLVKLDLGRQLTGLPTPLGLVSPYSNIIHIEPPQFCFPFMALKGAEEEDSYPICRNQDYERLWCILLKSYVNSWDTPTVEMLNCLRPDRGSNEQRFSCWAKFVSVMMALDPVFGSFALHQLEKRWNPNATAPNFTEDMFANLLLIGWNEGQYFEPGHYRFSVNEVWNLFRIVSIFFGWNTYVLLVYVGPCWIDS
jgi:hypothetical protein